MPDATINSYQSARDLPSVRELAEQLQGLKALTRFVARDKRAESLQLEQSLDRIVSVVDRFYSLLGSRNWILHDSLSLDTIEAALDLSPDEAEAAFIRHYKDREALAFQIRMLNRFPDLQARMPLIDCARRDYEEGRYYSTVLVLISVMDGFVNDVETGHRRGLHTREPDEMAAWDSVVGHHLGLRNAHRTFTKTFRKRSSDEVYELYRNGIVHGMLTNFDNEVVATKAWNRLFAVADWATAREKVNQEPEPEPTWRELVDQIRANEANRKALDAWQPSTLTTKDPGFGTDAAYGGASHFLESWKAQNYGAMGESLASLSRHGLTDRQTAGRVRDEYSLFELAGFEITKLDFTAPAICEVDVVLTLDGKDQIGRLRWIRENKTGDPCMPNESGEWRLVSWGPMAILDADRRTAADA